MLSNGSLLAMGAVTFLDKGEEKGYVDSTSFEQAIH